MIKQIALCCFAFLPATAGIAGEAFDENFPHISWEKAHEHYGQTCIVYGTVVGARDIGSRCFLNFHPDFRTNFTVVVNQEKYGEFPDVPDRVFLGKHVRVVGEIIEYKGKPEIIVSGAASIEIIDNPNPPEGKEGAKLVTPGAATETPEKPKMPKTPAVETEKPTASQPPRLPRTTASGTVKIVTFNVFNLFDDFDDPYVEHERLPGKSAEEQDLLAATLHRMNADVVALEEVENRPCLESFVETRLADLGYGDVVFFEGNSNRGIDVALLSRLPVGPVTSHRHLEFPDGNGKTMRFQRDLLEVRIEPEGYKPFEVFVVHLKSKYGGVKVALPIRLGEARTIRRIFNEKLAAQKDARFVICGDFNDTFESEPLQTIVGEGPTALRSFFEQLPSEKRVTYNKEPYLSMIDFIFASPAMGADYVESSYDVLPGSVASGGSDHNPVSAVFKLERIVTPK